MSDVLCHNNKNEKLYCYIMNKCYIIIPIISSADHRSPCQPSAPRHIRWVVFFTTEVTLVVSMLAATVPAPPAYQSLGRGADCGMAEAE